MRKEKLAWSACEARVESDRIYVRCSNNSSKKFYIIKSEQFGSR